MTTVLGLLFLLIFPLAASAERIGIDFERPLREGDSFECFAKLSRSFEYSLLMPGALKPVEKHESIFVSFAGKMTVKKVNGAGNAERLLLDISSLSGTVNGIAADAQALAGTSVDADLTVQPAAFSRTEDGEKLPENALALLCAVFTPASDNSLADLAGKYRTVEKGVVWKPVLTKFLALLKARRIECGESLFDASVVCLGKMKLRELDCLEFRLSVRTKDIPGYVFRYDASFVLPVEKRNGPAVRISRNAKEFIDRTVSASNRFAAGAKLSQVSVESADITMFRAAAPEKKPLRGKEPFFNLLRGR